jgi:beta-glucanase (GH16 family)
MAAILTWPESDVWPRDGEIDILETPHNENMFSTHYAGPDGSHWYDSIRSNTFDAAQWNHYEMTWLPDRLTIAVNGNVVAEWTDPSQIPDVPLGFGAMGFVGSGADQWMGGAPDASTPDQVVISIDNVRMYQLDGVL